MLLTGGQRSLYRRPRRGNRRRSAPRAAFGGALDNASGGRFLPACGVPGRADGTGPEEGLTAAVRRPAYGEWSPPGWLRCEARTPKVTTLIMMPHGPSTHRNHG
ncbi:hypothetical protein GCM10009602_46550 [Nocardiopsis tropica]